MPDYEFRFFRQSALCALHVTAVSDDTLACERARAYLRQTPEYDRVEIRSGIRFMLAIHQGECPGVPDAAGTNALAS